MYRLRDSLSLYPIRSSMGIWYSDNIPQFYSLNEYKSLVDQKMDPICAEIIRNKDPRIDLYYKKIDSLQYMDSTAVFELLSNTNYELYCGQYLLKKIAREKPGLLIYYIDKNPRNKDTLLRSIRNGNNDKEIVSAIKSCPVKTHGKKLIIKQRSQRVAGDIGAGAFYIGIILAEITLLVLLFKWIAG
jgi:hypothetical protein